MAVRRLVLAALFFALAATSAHAECRLRAGDHVVLYGTSDDPDVFVWDSRFRMRQYQGGSWDEAQALVRHALLAPPGTRGVVSSCISNFVLSKYSSTPDDAVGVTIISGRFKGRLGWVLGSDIRGVYRSVQIRR